MRALFTVLDCDASGQEVDSYPHQQRNSLHAQHKPCQCLFTRLDSDQGLLDSDRRPHMQGHSLQGTNYTTSKDVPHKLSQSLFAITRQDSFLPDRLSPSSRRGLDTDFTSTGQITYEVSLSILAAIKSQDTSIRSKVIADIGIHRKLRSFHKKSSVR